MRTFIVTLLAVVVGIVIAGFGLGWFKFYTSPGEQNPSLTLSVNEQQVKHDRVIGGKDERDEFLAQSEKRFKAMDLNLAELKTKANIKNGLAATKERMDEAIADLRTRTEAARVELQEFKTATPERRDALKAHLSSTLQELEARFEKVFSRFMNEWTLSR